LLTATQDCIDPPDKNSIPVFLGMSSHCAFVPSVVGGSHCQYAASSFGCSTTEKLCGAHPNITREVQVDVALSLVLPFLDAAFGKTKAGWASFNAVLKEAISNHSVSLMAHRSDACMGLSEPSPELLQDADFATACQRRVAHAAKGKLSINLVNASSFQFLTTKPSLKADKLLTNVNVTMLMHTEDTQPFSHSIAIKMKSGQAINPDAAADDVSCASLHNKSLATALSVLTPTQRAAYGNIKKRLIFGADVLYHTGLWVAVAKLKVTEEADAVTIVAPRFFASTKVPGQWGGVVYCRLVPPAALRDWIIGQLPQSGETHEMIV